MGDTMANRIFQSLNKAQSLAVSSKAATVAILAGPGSGKTHTLTSRVVWLIDHVGIKPCDVLVATFTVKASNEMKMRIGQALGDGREKKIILGTFHSIARRYLVTYGQRIGLDPKFGIADDSDSSGVIKRICKRLNTHIEPARARAWISKRKAKGTSDEQAVRAKNGEDIESQTLEQCYQEYQSHLERSNLLDYDDLLVRCVELLRKFPSCVSNIQTVLIDEYQDTNGVQYDLMKLFAQKNRRITAVGDPDQSIYGWRSAEIRNLHRLLRDFPGTDEISLEENYRSSSSIIDVSLKVIQQDRERYKKALLPVHDRGTRPVLRKLKNATAEADWLVSEIKRIKLMSGNMIRSDDFAILLRSASLSRHIESALGREGISYRMVGGFKFYERTEIKTILDYLRIIHQPDNNDALARIINVPKRGIGDVTIKSLLEEAERNNMSLWNLLGKHCRGDRIAKITIRKETEQKISGELIKLVDGLRNRLRSNDGTPVNLVETINQLLRDLRFAKYLEDTHGPEYESRWANVQEFVGLAEEFMNHDEPEEEMLPVIEGSSRIPDNDVLARFLAKVSLASEKQTDDKDKKANPQVTVSTIHAAKGLEWPVVFIPAVYNGSIPHVRSEDVNEERRLLYVAMTRAKALLYLSRPMHTTNSGRDILQLSPFIEDISSSNFIKRGPSFDRAVMSQVARILQRELPPEEAIYKGMPPMAALEDNLFPVDPAQPQRASSSTDGGNIPGQGPGPNKRQKLHHNGGSVKVAEDSIDGWATPYATTMQRAASFTVPQPPQSGFTTAGAHYASVTAAEAKSAAKPTQGAARKPQAYRAPVQRDLLGYGYGVVNHDKSHQIDDEPPPPSRPSQLAPYRNRFQRSKSDGYGQRGMSSLPSAKGTPAPGAIDPGLANHKLGSAKMSSKPTSRREPEQDEASKQYVCFSSSPTKPSPEQQQPSKEVEVEVEKENVVPLEEKTRPATSFHATTVNGAKVFRAGGIQRPAPLGRSGITPMDKLKRPFKLSVKRP